MSNTDATDERIRMLAMGLTECNIRDAVIIFEMKTDNGIVPHVLKIGSPMACLALTGWAYKWQCHEADRGFDLNFGEDDDEAEHEV